MAIDLKNSYFQKAHRLSLYNVSDSVTDVFAGQLFQLNSDGEWEYADGTKKAYPTLNDRFAGQGIGPQGERLEGRDNVSRTGKIAVLKGNFEIATDQFEATETFTPGMALYPAAGGKVVPFDSATAGHLPEFICGYVTIPPSPEHPMLRYEG